MDKTPTAALEALTQMAARVKASSRALARTSTTQRDDALEQMARAILDHSAQILEENQRDLAAAREKGLAEAFIDRLALDETRLGKMAAAIREVIALPDPLGGTIPASVVHRVALTELADRFAIVVKDTAALTAAPKA